MKFCKILTSISLMLYSNYGINAMDVVNKCTDDYITPQTNQGLELKNDEITSTESLPNGFYDYKEQAQQTYALCNKICRWIDYLLISGNVLEKEGSYGVVFHLTEGAHAVAEQLSLAAKHLCEDKQYSDSYNEHAEVFNMLLDDLNTKANKDEITTIKEHNEHIKSILSKLNPIEIKQ